MTEFRADAGRDPLHTADDDAAAESERREKARKIALDSLKEDHHVLELDAKLAFGPAALLWG